MDTDTLIIWMMLAAAFCWYLIIQITESRKIAKEHERQIQDRLVRAERIKRLLNKQ